MNKIDKGLKVRLYKTRTLTRPTRKTRRFSTQIAVLIESGFPRNNRNMFHIKTWSFVYVNYHNYQTIDYKDGLFVTANSTVLQKLWPILNFEPDHCENILTDSI